MDEAEFDPAFGFPSEFPYEFHSPGAEPVESGSTGTESSDEEDFFAGLTRRLSHASLHETKKEQPLTVPICNREKAESQKMLARGLAGSPQSILSGIGSWSGRSGGSGDGSPNGCSRVPSPTTTPFKATNDAWDVLYAAAGQVARLRVNDEVSSKLEFQNGGGFGGVSSTVVAENAFFVNHGGPQARYQQVKPEQMLKQQCGSVWGRQEKVGWVTQQQQQPQVQSRVRVLREFGYDNEALNCTRPLPHSAWHRSLQVKHQNQQVSHFGTGSRPVLQAGSGGVNKRGCAGTGVFLPRQYGAPPPESRKKTSCAAPVLVPAKVIHALNLNIDDLNASSQQRFSSAFGADYDALLARRNALLLQQKLTMRREEVANHELRLPQEWTY